MRQPAARRAGRADAGAEGGERETRTCPLTPHDAAARVGCARPHVPSERDEVCLYIRPGAEAACIHELDCSGWFMTVCTHVLG